MLLGGFIFQIKYVCCETLNYHQMRKELEYYVDPVVSMRIVANWVSYCWETITIYKLEDQRAQRKKGAIIKWWKLRNQSLENVNIIVVDT